jgi:hypothetical protein
LANENEISALVVDELEVFEFVLCDVKMMMGIEGREERYDYLE